MEYIFLHDVTRNNVNKIGEIVSEIYPDETVVEEEANETSAGAAVAVCGVLHCFPDNHFHIWAGIAVVADTEPIIRTRTWARRIDRWV